MGVPALFRWLSAKYPKIVEPVVEAKPADEDDEGKAKEVNIMDPNPNGVEFDNLYLDMNGIIHPCCHPENQDAPPSEQDMMVEIFKYIDRIMGMIRPRKVLYLAIDGVAPRAKMNQQRSRRFRAAMEANQKSEAAAAAAAAAMSDDEDEEEEENASSPFDSNCITPGTPFMKLVSDSLKFYTIDRMNNNLGWKGIKVIFSDASVPGEGEHKIMDFIRRQRLDPNYDPNTKHVIYGLDADLIMLSMATHEPYFKVLREDVFAEDREKNNNCRRCNKPGHYANQCTATLETPSKRKKAEEGQEGKYKLIEKPFIFLDIPTLREYLEAEMKPPGEIPYKFNADRAIDDWIFLCFFVGNDFLPHLPSLEIREGAIDILIDIYKKNAARLGGYICTDGVVNLTRAAIIMEELGRLEPTIFRKRREKEVRQLDNARRRKEQAEMAREAESEYRQTQLAIHKEENKAKSVDEVALGSMDNAEILKYKNQLREQNMAAAKALRASLNAAPVAKPVTETKPEEPVDVVRLWEGGSRERYYQAKFTLDGKDDPVEFLGSVTRAYAEGLCWVMAYYYQGCPSWKWFYPFHYAPFAADLSKMGEVHVRFELGEPFRPFDQLMGVFPAASSTHIPEPFRPLMTEPDSEVIDFYPETFHIDLNGKRAAWQGVALLPFIDEVRLLAALERVYPQLDAEQIALNARGDPKIFSHADVPPRYPQDLPEEQAEKLTISMDPSDGSHVAGNVRLALDVCALGSEIPSPLTAITKIKAVTKNVVRCFHYLQPYHERRKLHFRAALLPGVELPPRRLTEEDKYLVQSGAASRSFSSRLVINTSGGHHSMHREHAQHLDRQQEYNYGSERSDQYNRHSYDQRRDYQQYPPQRQYQTPYQQPPYPPPHQYEPSYQPHQHHQQYQRQQPQHYPPPQRPGPNSNPFASLQARRPEDLYPPPPPAPPGFPPVPPVPPASANQAFQRPQPPRKDGPSMDDLYGIPSMRKT